MRRKAWNIGLCTQALFAVLALPPELVTFDKIADELRVPIATKIHDMRSNYGLIEVSPATAWNFVDDSGEVELTVRRTRQLSTSKDSYHENIQFISWGSVIYEETIDTRGTHLSETDLERRLLLDSTSGYGLQSDPTSGLDETDKTILISVGKSPALRYTLHKVEKDGTRSTFIEMAVSGKPVLKIVDTSSDAPSLRTYTYSVLSDNFIIRLFNNSNGIGGLPAAGTYQVRVEKPAGYARAQTTYRANGEKFYSFDGFMNEFNSDVYDLLITQGTLRTFTEHVQDEFPTTQRRQNPAQGGKLLEELSQILTKLQAPVLTPSDQILIRNRILGYMDAVRDGSITDRRKDSAPGGR